MKNLLWISVALLIEFSVFGAYLIGTEAAELPDFSNIMEHNLEVMIYDYSR